MKLGVDATIKGGRVVVVGLFGGDVAFDQVARDRQPKPEAACGAVAGLALLHEQINTWGSVSGSMPTPVSRTCRNTCSPTGQAATPIKPPEAVYFAALETRFRHDLDETDRIDVDGKPELWDVNGDVLRALIDERADQIYRLRDNLGQTGPAPTVPVFRTTSSSP